MCAPARGPRAGEGEGRTRNALLPQAQECLITALSGSAEMGRKKNEPQESAICLPGSHNLTGKVIPWCELIYDRSEEAWGHQAKNSTSRKGEGRRPRAPEGEGDTWHPHWGTGRSNCRT